MTVIVQPNPFVNATPWGVVEIGGLRLPGVVLSINGADTPEEWNVQKPTEKEGATTVWKGTTIAESIDIELALATRKAFDAYYETRDALRPKRGTKPPTLSIINPAINFTGVTRVSCRNVAPPKWVSSGGYWLGKVTVLEYRPPKPANTGASTGGGNGSTGGAGGGAKDKPDPDADLQTKVKNLTNQAKNL
jgi:hypothetical protein